MVEFDERIREDKDYLKSIMEKTKVIEHDGSTFYYIKKNKRNQVFFFGSKSADDTLDFLVSQFGSNFKLHIFEENHLEN